MIPVSLVHRHALGYCMDGLVRPSVLSARADTKTISAEAMALHAVSSTEWGTQPSDPFARMMVQLFACYLGSSGTSELLLAHPSCLEKKLPLIQNTDAFNLKQLTSSGS